MVKKRQFQFKNKETIENIIRNTNPNELVPAGLNNEFLIKGLIVTLKEEETDEALESIAQAVYLSPFETIQEFSLKTLLDLAIRNNPTAISKLFQLAIQFNNLPAFQLIQENSLKSPNIETQIIFEVLAGNPVSLNSGNNYLKALTQAFDNSDFSLQERILLSAQSNQLDHWAAIMQAFRAQTQEAFQNLVNQYAIFNSEERNLTRDLLNRLAVQGNEICETALCDLFIQYEDEKAKEITQHNHFSPQAPVQRALYLFLTGQWEAYNIQDFDGSMIRNGYETASSPLRKRILHQSRISGYTEWLASIQTKSNSRTKYLTDLSNADWVNTVDQLISLEKYNDLWKLAQAASPFWSAKIICKLASINWTPKDPEENSFYQECRTLADKCLNQSVNIEALKTYTTLQGITCLALDDHNQQIAAAGQSSDVVLLDTSSLDLKETILPGTTQGIQALEFAQESNLLAAASTDKKIRIFSITDKKLIKTLSGHTDVIRTLAVSSDERTLFSGSFDRTIKSWRFPLGPETASFGPGFGEIHDLAVNSTNEFLLTASADGVIRSWHLPELELLREMKAHEEAVNRIDLSAQGPFIAAYGIDQKLSLWNYQSGKKLAEVSIISDKAPLTCVQFLPGTNFVITGNHQGAINLWNLQNSEIVPVFNILAGNHRITGLRASKTGEYLYCSDIKGTIRKWDLRPLTLTFLPISNHSPHKLQEIQSLLNILKKDAPKRNWIEFLKKMTHWNLKFEIEIGERVLIEAGQFDIQL